jgi:hypothetical protein
MGALPRFTYTCSSCSELHEGLPDFACSAPAYWDPEEEAPHSWLTSDLCRIGGHFFIRCVLRMQITGVADSFGWGIWLSQSEANFLRYLDGKAPPEGTATFGYVANRLEMYPDTLSMHAIAVSQGPDIRPVVELQPCDHPLYEDWKLGIPVDRAVALVRKILHREN